MKNDKEIKEHLYVGKVNGERKYALWHNAPNWQGETVSYCNFGSSFSKLASYLEGAAAHHWTEMKIINGIPDKIRRRTYESTKINKLTKKSFEELIEEAGLKMGGKDQVMKLKNCLSF